MNRCSFHLLSGATTSEDLRPSWRRSGGRAWTSFVLQTGLCCGLWVKFKRLRNSNSNHIPLNSKYGLFFTSGASAPILIASPAPWSCDEGTDSCCFACATTCESLNSTSVWVPLMGRRFKDEPEVMLIHRDWHKCPWSHQTEENRRKKWNYHWSLITSCEDQCSRQIPVYVHRVKC